MKSLLAIAATVVVASIAQADYYCRCELGRAGNPVFTAPTLEQAYANASAYCGLGNTVDCGEVVRNADCVTSSSSDCVHTSDDYNRYGRQ